MKITRLCVQNYRTLENLDLRFESLYSAICGKNDSGKTNLVSCIRCIMKEHDPFGFTEGPEFSLRKDFTKWVQEESGGRTISVELEFLINPDRDTGLFKFLQDYLSLAGLTDEMPLRMSLHYGADGLLQVRGTAGDQDFEDIKAQEVLKKLQTSRTFLFHSSTDLRPTYGRRFQGVLRDVSDEYAPQLENSKKTVNRVVKRIARDQQQAIEGLLGRLSQRYKVGLSYPTFDLAYFPYDITLRDGPVEVELGEWGSGTRNRMEILLTIFRAKQVAESGASASKVTPIIVVEEPESFLHPQAQAEFGRVLQDLSGEFKVQILVTTHSPYLLSLTQPEANILLDRHVVRRQLRGTKRTNTSGDNWMRPFELALGISSTEFRPWKKLFFSSPNAILLVEGDIDKEYFDLLRDPAHGSNTLRFDGEIFPYNGRNTLGNQVLLRFIKQQFSPVFVTFDLDSEDQVERTLQALEFEKKKSYLPIGVDQAGKKSIEGLLPDSVFNSVNNDNPDLARAAFGGTSQERKDAKQKLKRLYLERFKSEARPGEEYFGAFYPIARIITKALS